MKNVTLTSAIMMEEIVGSDWIHGSSAMSQFDPGKEKVVWMSFKTGIVTKNATTKPASSMDEIVKLEELIFNATLTLMSIAQHITPMANVMKDVTTLPVDGMD